ncbi:MAG: putative lipid II flippase FtsW [Deltaproteobacteria bacterium]|nr:putative lipid II flippase FtsW [Deltaproteobacteria bacterium]
MKIRTLREKINFIPLRQGDVWLWIATFCLLGLGILMVFSTTAVISQENYGNSLAMLWRHLFHIGLGLILAFIILQIETVQLDTWGRKLLMVSVVLLVLVAIPSIGQTAGGARRWLGFGPVRIQPGEFIKLFVLIYFAGYIGRYSRKMCFFIPGIMIPFAILGLLGGLFLWQPDFGTVVVITLVVLAQLFTASNLWHLVTLGISVAGLFAVAVATSGYRMRRFKAFLDPFADPNASGYQLIQSLIAVGSGGFVGTGIGGSTQKLYYLPASHTDFIYAVIGEELGLVGAVVILSLFVLIAYRGVKIAFHFADDAYRCALAIGCTALIVFPAMLNMGVVLGLLPTKGLVLPFVSYGGTAIMGSLAAMALLIRLSEEGISNEE